MRAPPTRRHSRKQRRRGEKSRTTKTQPGPRGHGEPAARSSSPAVGAGTPAGSGQRAPRRGRGALRGGEAEAAQARRGGRERASEREGEERREGLSRSSRRWRRRRRRWGRSNAGEVEFMGERERERERQSQAKPSPPHERRAGGRALPWRFDAAAHVVPSASAWTVSHAHFTWSFSLSQPN